MLRIRGRLLFATRFSQFFFGFAEAVFDRPTPKRDSQDHSQGPTAATGHAV